MTRVPGFASYWFTTAEPIQFRCTVVSAPGEPHVRNSAASKVEKFGEKWPLNVLLLKRHEGSRTFPTFEDDAMKSSPSRVPENDACALGEFVMSCWRKIEPDPTFIRH